MRTLSRWTVGGFGLLGLFGVLAAVWSVLPAPARAIAADQDRAGGVQLLLEADMAEFSAKGGVNDNFSQVMAATREAIARRINALGRFESRIVQQGVNRILVQVPGMQDPEALKRLIGRTARLEFRLVELDSIPCDTPRRSGVQYLPADELPDNVCMGVQSRAMLSDEQITDALQNYNENDEVAVTVSFNAEGSQRFARVTQAHVGRRFAIVLDNRIISAPAIREPILGGMAQISGAFTVESASQLAIQLRSGRLPVALRVVDERRIGPNIRPAGATAAN